MISRISFFKIVISFAILLMTSIVYYEQVNAYNEIKNHNLSYYEKNYISCKFNIVELENYMIDLLTELGLLRNTWAIKVLDSNGSFVASFGDISNLNTDITFLNLMQTFYPFKENDTKGFISSGTKNENNPYINLIGFAPYYSPEYILFINKKSYNEENSVDKFYIREVALGIFYFITGRYVKNEFFIPITNIENLLSLENGLVYFGRPTCHSCAMFAPIIFELATSAQRTVYYFNTDKWRGHTKFRYILDLFNVRGVPHLSEIKNFTPTALYGDNVINAFNETPEFEIKYTL